MQLQNKMSYLVVMATTIFAAIFAIEQVYNYDIWWHLKYGDWIIENKEILREDLFSFSTYGALWINTAWLGSLLFSAINNMAGLDALILFKAFIIGISFGGGCFYLIKKGLNPYVAAFVIGYAVVTARFRFLLRPLIFMFPFTLALLWILSDDSPARKKILLLGVPVTVVWANLHGSSYLAPVFSGFLFLEKCIEWFWHKYKSLNRIPFPGYELMLTAFLGIAVLLTPFGIDSLKLVLDRFLVQDIITRTYSVQEHLPLEWGSHKMFWGLLFTTGFSFFLSIKRIRLFSLFVFVATGWLALSSIRYAGLVSLVYAILLGQNLLAFPVLEKLPPKVISYFALPAILLATAIFSFTQTFGPTKVYQWGIGINSSRYPVEAVNFLQQRNFNGNLFNSWPDGGYILYHLPESRNFIDGRGLTEQLAVAEKIKNIPPHELQSYLDANKVEAALLSNSDTAYVDFFKISPQFQLSHLDDKHVVFMRSGQKEGKENAAFNFRFIHPQGFDFQYLQPLVTSNQAPQVEEEFRQALIQFPNNFSLTFQFALFLDMLNKPEAVDFYLKAAKINPSLGFSHFNLAIAGGRSALKHQRWKGGTELLESSLDYGGKTLPEVYFLLGSAHYQLKNYSEAEKFYRRHLKAEPNAANTLINLGFVYIDTGKYKKAEKIFLLARENHQKFEGAYYGYALSLEKQGKTAAQPAWKEFLRLFPGSRWAKVAKNYLSME